MKTKLILVNMGVEIAVGTSYKCNDFQNNKDIKSKWHAVAH